MPDIPTTITAKCTGCSLCAARCPQQCIDMKRDKWGFLTASIDTDHCIGCGLCVTSCPSNNPVELHKAQTAFSSWALDKGEQKSSTSGGFAAVLSRYTIQQGGVVYGCAFLPDGLRFRHVRIDTEEGLAVLKGSKYVQSDLASVIRHLLIDLKQGLQVLFIGTPCQVAGVKRLAGKTSDRLLTVDLVCHGVPSEAMFRSHVTGLRLADHPDRVSFREPRAYALKLFAGDRLLYEGNVSRKNWSDLYMNAFYKSLISRDCCYTCPYATPSRTGDLTIGDFWGIGAKAPLRASTEEGISLVLPNTPKGQETLEVLKEVLYLEERPLAEALEGNDHLLKYSRKTWRTLLFYYLYPRFSFGKAVRISAADWIGKNSVKSFIHRYRKC